MCTNLAVKYSLLYDRYKYKYYTLLNNVPDLFVIFIFVFVVRYLECALYLNAPSCCPEYNLMNLLAVYLININVVNKYSQFVGHNSKNTPVNPLNWIRPLNKYPVRT